LQNNVDSFVFRHDLLAILTEVSRTVSDAITQDGGFKQVPAPTSSLTKKVHFGSSSTHTA